MKSAKSVLRLRPDLEQALGLVQAVRFGDLVFVGGITAVDGQGQVIGAGDFRLQLETAYATLATILRHYGAGPGQVLKETILATDAPALWACLPVRQAFYANAEPPALTTAEVQRFVLPGILVTLEAVVALPA